MAVGVDLALLVFLLSPSGCGLFGFLTTLAVPFFLRAVEEVESGVSVDGSGCDDPGGAGSAA